MRTAIAAALLLAACSTTARPQPTPGAIGFDDQASASGWRFDSTGGIGPHATWQARADLAAVSPPAVMALVQTNHRAEDRFNLCWSEAVSFGNGHLALCLRADGGAVDRGGGPMWRVRDANNYYVCRYNPLEANFRLYVVKDGVRRQLATALVETNGEAWHRIEVDHDGTKIVCRFDGKALLTADDRTITGPGGVGLWTKADACTSFDDFLVARSD